MVHLCVKELLAKKEKSIYWLAKEAKLSYPGLYKIAQGKTARIELDVLERLCLALDCTPNDLIQFRKP